VADPSRQRWWREALPEGAVLVLGMAALSMVTAYRKDELRAQTPDIIYGELREFKRGGWRNLPDGPYLLVSLPNGTLRYLKIGNRDEEGCRVGSRVAIEQRGMNLSLAPIMCPDAAMGKR
jgi:hypothetical protein